ncbi:extended synaptotagmin-1 [Histomonas meleagridis]|nr:extended synaptotagmin-1 [Histomonas meleagridis]
MHFTTTREKLKEKKNDTNKKYISMTRVIFKSLNPTFNQIFHIPIDSFGTDIIKVVLYDYDKNNKDDKLCTFTYKVSDMGNGIIKDEWLPVSNRTGEIHIVSQVTDFNQYAFVEHQIKPGKVHVCIHDAFDLPRVDKVTKNDCFCKVSLEHDITKAKTKAIQDSSTPQWFQNMSFIMNSQTTDDLIVEVYDEGNVKDRSICQLKLPLSKFEPNLIYDEYYTLEPTVKSSENYGQIHLKVLVDPMNTLTLDTAPYAPQPLQSPSTGTQFHVHIISASNLSTQKINPYAKLEFIGRKNTTFTTRTIDKSSFPYYNQYFRLDIPSLSTDTFKLTFYDSNVGVDTKLSSHLIPLNSLQCGKVYYETIKLSGYHDHSRLGSVTLRYHIAAEGQTPFIEQLFVPNQLHFHISQYLKPVESNKEGNNEMFFRLQLENDLYCESTTNRIDFTWEENFSFIITDLNRDKLILTGYKIPSPILERVEPVKVCEKIISLSNMTIGQVVDLSDEDIRCFGQILPIGQEYFIGQQFNTPPPLKSYSNYMIHMHFIEAVGIEAQDVDNSADPYCKISFSDKDFYTPVIRNTLHPKWNYIVSREIRSYQWDKLKIKLYDYDYHVSKDDLIGKFRKYVSEFPRSIVFDEWLTFKGNAQLHIRIHVTAPGQIPFVDQQPFTLHKLYLQVNEAIIGQITPGILSKYNPYCKVGINDVKVGSCTSILHKTSTPQWYQFIEYYITNPQTDSITFYVMDKINDKDSKQITKTTLQLCELEIGKTYQNWLTLEDKNKIFVRYQLVIEGTPKFTDFVEVYDKVTEDKYMMHVIITRGYNLSNNEFVIPYVKLKSKTFEQSTRAIENNKSPIWNQEFHIPIRSIEQEILTIFVNDKYDNEKSMLVEYIYYNQNKLGVVQHRDITHKNTKLQIIYQITAPGQTSYVDAPFNMNRLNVRVIGNSGSLGFNSLLNVKLESDLNPSYSTIRNAFSDDFEYIPMPNDKLNISLCQYSLEHTEEKTKPQSIPLTNLELNKVYTNELDLNPGHVQVQYQLIPHDGVPFNPQPISPGESENMHVYMKVNNTQLLHYYYIRVSFLNQKSTTYAYSRIISKQQGKSDIIGIDVIGLNTAMLLFELIRFNSYKEDQVIDKETFRLMDVGFGLTKDTTINFRTGGQNINISLHLAAPLQKAFVPQPFIPLQLHFVLMEAINIPKVDKLSKNDCYCSLKLSSDIYSVTSSVCDNTQTPQWGSVFSFVLTTMDDAVEVKLFDKNVTKSKEISDVIAIPINAMQVGVPVTGWLNLKTTSGKDCGSLNYGMIIQPYGEMPMISPKMICYESVPEELLKEK